MVVAMRLMACIVAALATYRCWEAMLIASLSGSETSAAMIALPISAYLLWKKRSDIEFTERGNLGGLAVLLLGTSLFLAGSLGGARLLSQVGSIAIGFGLFASALSPRSFRQLLPVLVTLMFVVELPGFCSQYVSLPLAKLNASLAATSINQFGYPVELQGTILTTDRAQLQVVDACDGLRFFWAVVLISFAMCVVRRVSIWGSLLVLSVTPIIALALNTVRIASVVFAFQILSPDNAEQFHDLSAWFMMAGACVIPSVLMNLLPFTRQESAVRPRETGFAIDRIQCPTPFSAVASLTLPVMAILIVAMVQDAGPEPVSTSSIDKALQNVAYRLDSYVAEDVGLPERQLAVLRPDALLSRRYTNLTDESDFLMIVSFHQDGEAHSGHSVHRCYGASGWQVQEIREHAKPELSKSIKIERFQLSRHASGNANSQREERVIHSFTAGFGASQSGKAAHPRRPELLRVQLVFNPEISREIRNRLTELAVEQLENPLSVLSSDTSGPGSFPGGVQRTFLEANFARNAKSGNGPRF